MLEAVEEIVALTEPGMLPPARLGVTFERATELLTDSAKRRAERAQRRQAEDFDEEEAAALEVGVFSGGFHQHTFMRGLDLHGWFKGRRMMWDQGSLSLILSSLRTSARRWVGQAWTGAPAGFVRFTSMLSLAPAQQRLLHAPTGGERGRGGPAGPAELAAERGAEEAARRGHAARGRAHAAAGAAAGARREPRGAARGAVRARRHPRVRARRCARLRSARRAERCRDMPAS